MIKGIYDGIFTPIEAEAVFILGVFVYKDSKISEIAWAIRDSVKISIMFLFIIANALLFAFMSTHARIPHKIT